MGDPGVDERINIKMDLQEVEWIELAHDTDRWRELVTTIMNLGVPFNAANFFASLKSVGLSRRTPSHGVT